jgi:rRNA maturation RNase YbeY
MKSTLHLIEEVSSSFPKKLYSDVMHATLAVSRFQTEDGFRLSGKKVTLHAIAVSERKIRELNKEYRGRDTATDILSFGEETLVTQKTKVFLGELFFSPRFIQKQAKNDQGPYREAMIYIFSHGILHLLGYDHGKKMFAYQDEVTKKMFTDSRKPKEPAQKKKKTKV